ARLSAGTDNGGGKWSLTESDLEGLTYLVPPRSANYAKLGSME
ncbi:MAG: hypothetical protein CFH02_01142, partial [Alphaproteobacteria bacterium MarineAlpha3_Bin1]